MLRQSWTGVLAGVSMLLLLPAPAQAQGGGMVPGGSYLNSCKDVQFDPATNLLSATCDFNDPGGLWAKGEPVRGAPFNVTGCADNSIWNDNGSLYCLASKPWGHGRVIPKGSYIDTCSVRRVVNNVLIAECGYEDGKSRSTEVNLNGCKWGGDISNDNGALKCESVIGGLTHEFTPTPDEVVKPVAVEPAVVKPVEVLPAVPVAPSPIVRPVRKKPGERG
jgi:hypothetical protein